MILVSDNINSSLVSTNAANKSPVQYPTNCAATKIALAPIISHFKTLWIEMLFISPQIMTNLMKFQKGLIQLTRHFLEQNLLCGSSI